MRLCCLTYHGRIIVAWHIRFLGLCCLNLPVFLLWHGTLGLLGLCCLTYHGRIIVAWHIRIIRAMLFEFASVSGSKG